MTRKEALSYIKCSKIPDGQDTRFVAYCPFCADVKKFEHFVNRSKEDVARNLVVGGLLAHFEHFHKFAIDEEPERENKGETAGEDETKRA